jgi:branched-chain amino acid transport system ATP-binding protein
MEVIARFAERVLAFYDGRIIADGPPDRALRDSEVQRYVVGGELQKLDAVAGVARA